MRRQIAAAHPPQQHQERHVGKAAAGLPPGNTKASAASRLVRCISQDRQRASGQRNAVFAVAAFMRAAGRSKSCRASRFRSTARRSSRRCCAAVRIGNSSARAAMPSCSRKPPGRPVARRRAVRRDVRLAHLGARRQQLVQMAAPARRILAAAISSHLGQVQDALDPPADAACRFWLRRPDRFQHLEHERGVDRLHGQSADDRIGVGGKCRAPLRRVLAVAPSGAVRAM